MEGMESWDVVDQECWMNVLLFTHSKSSVFPIELFKLLKARLCALEDKQIEGIDVFDFFDAFVPVVN